MKSALLLGLVSCGVTLREVAANVRGYKNVAQIKSMLEMSKHRV